MGVDEVFEVLDHDFSRSSLTPSVTFKVNIPLSSDLSWYKGTVHVGVKDSVFQPSSPSRHAIELESIMEEYNSKPILVIYSDGGPDHRCTYVSVMYSMIYLFLKLDLDMLVLARTPPGASWKNPAERVMSQLNIALQSVGMMRQPSEKEDRITK